MPVAKFTGRITSITDRTPTVRSYTVQLPKGLDFTFLPGQFVSARMTGTDGKAYGPRSFSIASSPLQKDTIELTVKKTGVFTTALWQVREGHDLQLVGPFGLFTLDPDRVRDRDICLIAGGTGIAPLMSMLRWAQEKGLPNRIILIYSVRTRDDIIYALELAERCTASERLSCIITLTREERAKGWTGETGRVNAEKIRRHVPNIPQTEFYVCGPPEMVNGVVRDLYGLGADRGHVRIERWE
jgi:ferredoxin-NADP reductase